MQTASYYKNSGIIPPLAPVLMLTLGVAATWVMAFIYAYAIAYIPFIYISFILTAIFGLGIGVTVNLCGQFGKARNTTFTMTSALVLGLFGVYACWAVWFKAQGAKTGLFISPDILFKLVQFIAAEGAWSIFDSTPTGGALYAVWGIEAAIIIGVALFMVNSSANDTPFCEECKQWADQEKVVGPLAPIMDTHAFKSRIEQGHFQAILDLPLIEDRYIQYTIVKLLSCADFEKSTLFLTVQAVTVEVDEDGKESKDEIDIVKNLIINRAEYDQLLNHEYVQETEHDEDLNDEDFREE
ncbi:hypothetical protein [uncultured Microscilla sp.]|uniref:hypothetical protein n=1 Tax=uncultured Microscilla sp. TaxID=432653 RepID=UPI00262FE010|nr:hypothetical protein [uncultured Microscilla sp.]